MMILYQNFMEILYCFLPGFIIVTCLLNIYFPFFFLSNRMQIFFGKEMGAFWTKEKNCISQHPLNFGMPYDKYQAKKHRPKSAGSFRHFFRKTCAVSPSVSLFLSSYSLNAQGSRWNSSPFQTQISFISRKLLLLFLCCSLTSCIFFFTVFCHCRCVGGVGG